MNPEELTRAQVLGCWVGGAVFWVILLFISWVANGHAEYIDKWLT